MAIRDLFRSKHEPEWKHADVNVRLNAVRHLGPSELDLLRSLAQEDPAPPVRRAALRKIHDVGVLATCLSDEKDESVREEIFSLLVVTATSNADLEACERALEPLREERHLALVAKAAVFEAIRRTAVARLADAKILGQVARDAQDAEIRLTALSKIDDAGVLGSVAAGSEHKDVAVAAVERITDAEVLKPIAARARSKAAARRARALLDASSSTPDGGTLSIHERRKRQTRLCETLEILSRSSDWPRLVDALDDAEATWREHGDGAEPAVVSRYEAARRILQARVGAHEKEIAEAETRRRERESHLAARTELCVKADAAAGGDISTPLDELRAAWDGLEKTDDPEARGLASRFDQALSRARARQHAEAAAVALGPQAEAVCVEAETVAEEPDVREAGQKMHALERRWSELHIGQTASPELTERLQRAAARLKERQAQSRAERDKQNKENAAKIEALCVQLETLAAQEKPSLRDADKSLRECREALENLGPLASKEQREAFTARLKHARQALYPKVQEIKDNVDWQRWANVTIQEELCQKVEALAAREDLEVVAQELRDLDVRWKQASSVPKEKGEPLWQRFRTAREPLRAKCDAFFAARAAEHAENLKKKEALCVRAEALTASTDWVKTAQEIQALQAEWKTIGPGARSQSNALWERFHKACDTFFTRRKQDRHQRKEEWGKNREQKEALCVRAEELAESSDWDATAAELKKLQADWKGIGAVDRHHSETLWQRFRAACNQFFDRHSKRHDLDKVAQLDALEALVGEMEALVPAESETPPAAPEGLLERVTTLLGTWKQAGNVPDPRMTQLVHRFTSARTRVVNAYVESFRGTDLDPENNRKRMEKLCVRIEALANEVLPRRAESTVSMVEQLRNALASNTIGGKAAAEDKLRAAAAEVDTAREAWQRIGPVAGDEAHALGERFKKACDRILAERPPDKPAAPEPRERRDRNDRPRRPKRTDHQPSNR